MILNCRSIGSHHSCMKIPLLAEKRYAMTSNMVQINLLEYAITVSCCCNISSVYIRINCLFPMLRAYDTVLWLETPGTDCQGIYIWDSIFSSFTTCRGESIYMGYYSSFIPFLPFSSSWISVSVLTLHLEFFLHSHLLRLSPPQSHVFSEKRHWLLAGRYSKVMMHNTMSKSSNHI